MEMLLCSPNIALDLYYKFNPIKTGVDMQPARANPLSST